MILDASFAPLLGEVGGQPHFAAAAHAPTPD
jgi:hypothetical protein